MADGTVINADGSMTNTTTDAASGNVTTVTTMPDGTSTMTVTTASGIVLSSNTSAPATDPAATTPTPAISPTPTTIESLNSRLNELVAAIAADVTAEVQARIAGDAAEKGDRENDVAALTTEIGKLIDDTMTSSPSHTWSIDQIKAAISAVAVSGSSDTTIVSTIQALQAASSAHDAAIAALTAGAVRADQVQALTDAQKLQARQNIDAVAPGDVGAIVAPVITAALQGINSGGFTDVDLAGQYNGLRTVH